MMSEMIYVFINKPNQQQDTLASFLFLFFFIFFSHIEKAKTKKKQSHAQKPKKPPWPRAMPISWPSDLRQSPRLR